MMAVSRVDIHLSFHKNRNVQDLEFDEEFIHIFGGPPQKMLKKVKTYPQFLVSWWLECSRAFGWEVLVGNLGFEATGGLYNLRYTSGDRHWTRRWAVGGMSCHLFQHSVVFFDLLSTVWKMAWYFVSATTSYPISPISSHFKSQSGASS